jgi:hypothetical protein
MAEAKETYATYLLCTPTSIMAGDQRNGGRRRGSAPFG